MEYGIRARDLSGNGSGGNGPSSWLESAAASAAFGGPLAAAYQLPSSAALFLNSLHSLQSNAAAAAMELVWKPGKREPPDEEEDEEDEHEAEDGPRRDSEADNTRGADDRDERETRGVDEEEEEEEDDDDDDDDEDEVRRMDEEENEASAESWKDTSMPILSSWMLSAYTSMLSRLSAATAALEAADNSNITTDSGSESDRSSYTDMLSRESSPSNGVRRAYPCDRATNTATRTKKKRTSDCKPKPTNKGKGKEASSSDTAATDSTTTTSQGKKRSLALQRVRYRYEREEYRCSLCSYACTIEKAFQRHLRAHARGTATETRVSCAVCGADRSSEVDLNKHMRRHRDNRYFCCDICIFRTVQLKKLIQHRRMHTGEKPHLCPHCAYRSARRDNLRSHVRRVHKKENLYCDTFSPRGMFIAPKLHDLSQQEPEPVPSSSEPSQLVQQSSDDV